MNTNSQTAIKEEQNEDNNPEPHAFGRIIRYVGRGMLPRDWNVPSRERFFLRH